MLATSGYCLAKILQYATGRSINDIFGSDLACSLEYILFMVILANISFGNLGLSLYRYIVVKFPTMAKEGIGLHKLARRILALQWLIIITIVALGLIGIMTRLSFC